MQEKLHFVSCVIQMNEHKLTQQVLSNLRDQW
jgi:hypothetical protein